MSNDLPASHYLRSALRRADAAAGHLGRVVVRGVARRIKRLALLACLGVLLAGAYAVYDDYARQQRYQALQEQYHREWLAGADARKAEQDRFNEFMDRLLAPSQ